jgi:hypothetical protein
MENVVINIPLTIDPPLTEERVVQSMIQGLEKLIRVGALKGTLDEILLDYEVDIPNGVSKAVLSPNSLYDASKLTTIGASQSQINTSEDMTSSVKEFSAASVQEKFKVSRMSPKIRFHYLVTNYKLYYTQKKKYFDEKPEQLEILKNMFSRELMGLILDMRPYIEGGKYLNSLLGVSQILPGVDKLAKDLSIALFRAFKAEKSSGQISKDILQSLKSIYNDFVDETSYLVFSEPTDAPTESYISEDREFSASSIQERLRVSKMDKKLRFRYMITDYKRYYAQKRKQLESKPEQMKMLRNMFLQDIMGIFTEILPYIEQGKQLNTLLGVSQVTPTVNKQARDLSLIYRRALKAEKSSGQIPKTVYQSLKKAYTEFINALIPQVFPGMDDILQGGTPETDGSMEYMEEESYDESKSYSYTRDGRIRLF